MKAVYGFLSCMVLMGLRAEAMGENNANTFLQDIITTFRLTSPTIVYNEDEEAPNVCHSAKWSLCLPSGLTSWYPEDNAKSLINDSKKSEGDSRGDVKYTNNPHYECLFRLNIL